MKNIRVIDETGKEYSSTYPKRALGLIKKNRARWVNESTICLSLRKTEDKMIITKNDIKRLIDQTVAINYSIKTMPTFIGPKLDGTVFLAESYNDIVSELNAGGINTSQSLSKISTDKYNETPASVLSLLSVVYNKTCLINPFLKSIDLNEKGDEKESFNKKIDEYVSSILRKTMSDIEEKTKNNYRWTDSGFVKKDNYSAQSNDSDDELDDFDDELDDLEEELSTLEDELDELEDELDDQENELSEIEEDLDSLNDSDSEIDDIKQNIEVISKEIADKTCEIEELTKKISSIRTK